MPIFETIESRGHEEFILTDIDTMFQNKYSDFVKAIASGNLLHSQNGNTTADVLFRDLIKQKELAYLHRLMTRKIATALQDEAQQAINAYLLTNPTEIEKRWKG